MWCWGARTSCASRSALAYDVYTRVYPGRDRAIHRHWCPPQLCARLLNQVGVTSIGIHWLAGRPGVMVPCAAKSTSFGLPQRCARLTPEPRGWWDAGRVRCTRGETATNLAEAIIVRSRFLPSDHARLSTSPVRVVLWLGCVARDAGCRDHEEL